MQAMDVIVYYVHGMAFVGVLFVNLLVIVMRVHACASLLLGATASSSRLLLVRRAGGVSWRCIHAAALQDDERAGV